MPALLEKVDIPCAFAVSPANSVYLSGYVAGLYSRPVIPISRLDGDPLLVVPKIESLRAHERLRGVTIEVYNDSQNPFKFLSLTLRRHKVDTRRIGVDISDARTSTISEIQKYFKNSRLLDISPHISAMRMVKTEEEVRMISRSARIADAAVEEFVEKLRSGVTEVKITESIIDRIMDFYAAEFPEYDLGTAEELGQYCIIKVLSGKRTLYPHAFSNAKRIKKGESVVSICLPSLEGYLCEEERTVLIRPVPRDVSRILETLVQLREETIHSLKPGLRASEVDRYVVEKLKSRNLSRFLLHRTGHGIGITVHERPYLTSSDDTILSPGMVITVEPGLYLPDFGGIRNSDTVLITRNGHRILTGYDRTVLYGN
jgi:Xaa-Pro aminopeptidase